MATSKSAKETFSRLGMFGDRAMPKINHIPDPNARKFVHKSDKTFGNCYITLGLFLVVINALLLQLTAWLITGFRVESFWAALFGAIIISIITYIIHKIF